MLKKIIIIIAVLFVIAVGVAAYSVFRKPEAASGPIQAIPLNTETSQSTDTTDPTATAAPTVATVATSQPAAAPTEAANPSPEAEVPAQAGDAGAAQPAAAAMSQVSPASPQTFEIIPAQSEARFLIDEVLRGDPITVKGVTDQVAGQFALNPADLSSTQMGIVQVNARALATDNEFRNRAIKNRILLTDAHEFITFTPTQVTGLPESGAVGQTYTFQVAGDLTVTDVTRPVTFEVTATAVSETRIEGTASTTFPYRDFELVIPDSPSVDTVADDVRLEIDFVAETI